MFVLVVVAVALITWGITTLCMLDNVSQQATSELRASGNSLPALPVLPSAPPGQPQARSLANMPSNNLANPLLVPTHIDAELDQAILTPEQTATLTETIPNAEQHQIFQLRHTVFVIGKFDTKRGTITSLTPQEYKLVDPDLVFDDLPNEVSALHGGIEPNVFFERGQGYRFSLQPKKLGAYMIIAEWLRRDVNRHHDKVYSIPIVIHVMPPLDMDNKPIVRPEWMLKRRD
jgi:hypothetical protein